VVDEVAWAGDDLTSTRPLSIEDAIDAVSLELPAIGVEAVSVDRTCRRPLPAVVWQATGTSLIGSILVYSSVEAREAAGREPPFAPGCNGADALIVVPPSAIVDNVVVYTRFDDGTSDADRRALAATIEARLRATSEPTR
jgi:hypothetical protein